MNPLEVVIVHCDECDVEMYAWLDDVIQWRAANEVPLCQGCNAEANAL